MKKIESKKQSACWSGLLALALMGSAWKTHGAGTEATPAQAVSGAKAGLNIGLVVNSNLVLPDRVNGVDIRWKSSNAALISDSGKTTRPATGQPIGQVVLEATLSMDGVTDSKTFSISVLPAGHPMSVSSYNPILKASSSVNPLFTADPAVWVEGDTLYVYAGRDEARLGGWFSMNQWVCFSTQDMVNWKYEGVAMKATDFKWGTAGTAWAGHVVKKNGKYYFYSTTGQPNQKGYAIGVAVSDKPTGPFVDAKKAPLFDNALTTGNKLDSMEDIDPTVLLDDDGQAYIYWGNGKLHYALLSDDMLSIKDLNGDGKITEGADIFTDVPMKNMPGGFGEAPWLHKANGKYYLTYASGLPQKIAYAMSDSPRGPWQYTGVIQDENLCPDGSKGNVNSDTSHPAIASFKGQSYLFYHNAAQPSGGQTRRSVCVEKLQYNPNGTIQKTFITSTGLTGTASRLESLRHKGTFVRFSKYDLKTEAIKTDAKPFEWELMLGLANGSTMDTISLQSVSQPGYYLTHTAGKVELAKHDNTEAFKQKATFKKVPGLADKDWVSFESISEPGVYIRQSDPDGKLKADKITPESPLADREDATFKL